MQLPVEQENTPGNGLTAAAPSPAVAPPPPYPPLSVPEDWPPLSSSVSGVAAVAPEPPPSLEIPAGWPPLSASLPPGEVFSVPTPAAGFPPGFPPGLSDDDWVAEDGLWAPGEVRGLPLAPGEAVQQIFSADSGIVEAAPERGAALALTNRRIIALGQSSASRDLSIMPLSAVRQTSVRLGGRSGAVIFQGAALAVVGLLLYAIVAYWLAGRVDGPSIPVLNMDLAPFLALVVTLIGLAIAANAYLAKPEGVITIQGPGVQIAFPVRGAEAERQSPLLLNAIYAAAQRDSETPNAAGQWGQANPYADE